jgi:hypothetical protein
MARILIILAALAGAAALAAALLPHGSQAATAGAPLRIARPAAPSAPGPAPAALPQGPAPIQRTFVSTSGNDANLCTPTQPCRSFTAAIAQTTAGGEVIALDSGGYGPFTVNKALTIAGAHVAITVFSGTGIAVNAGSPDTTDTSGTITVVGKT